MSDKTEAAERIEAGAEYIGGTVCEALDHLETLEADFLAMGWESDWQIMQFTLRKALRFAVGLEVSATTMQEDTE